MLLSGEFHDSRGAIFPALQSMGLTEVEVRRTWLGFRYGCWRVGSLLADWLAQVEAQGQ